MISPELLRRYRFFAGLTHDNIVTLAKLAEEITVETGHHFFQEGDTLDNLYLILEGAIAVMLAVPDREEEQDLSGQLTGDLKTKDIVLNTVEAGEVFGWASLIPPHQTTAGVKALTPCRVVRFDCAELRKILEEDCRFGYLMAKKAAQLIQDRLTELRLQFLSYVED